MNTSNISSISAQNETQSSTSLYDSALDFSMTYSNFSENANNNCTTTSATANTETFQNLSTDYETTFNGSEKIDNKSEIDVVVSNISANLSSLLKQSESTDTNASQEEVDPKSQLANKTIFKTNNPNLSIIEINDNQIKDEELQNSVLLVESLSDEIEENSLLKRIDKTFTSSNYGNVDNAAAQKRRRKAQTLLHTHRQKLDIAIAEASASEPKNKTEPFHRNDEVIHNVAAKEVNGNVTAQNNETESKREIAIYDTIEEFEKNLPSTVTILDTPHGSRVYLVGTAHFSEESQNDVSFVIRNVRPDVVMVELCPSRIHILKLDEKTLLEEAKNFNLSKIRSIIQAHGYINGIFFILLLQMSAQIAKDLGMAPGGEFRRAFEEIHKIPGCELHLGDRPLRITIHRALRALSLWQTIKLVWRLASSDTISIEEVEECKQRDLLEKLMQEMAGEFPAFSEVFVKERDMFLCHSLQMAALSQAAANGSGLPRPIRVVGVVGIGHANGIAKMWGRVDPRKIPPIMEIPPASRSTRICKYTLKYGLIGLTLYGAFRFLRPRLASFA